MQTEELVVETITLQDKLEKFLIEGYKFIENNTHEWKLEKRVFT